MVHQANVLFLIKVAQSTNDIKILLSVSQEVIFLNCLRTLFAFYIV